MERHNGRDSQNCANEVVDDSIVGHHFGNFHSYYSFHPVHERLRHLPKGMFRAIWDSDGCQGKFAVLDIGCNEGDLTIAMMLLAASELPATVDVCALGIDMDDELIKRARCKSESPGEAFPSNCHIQFEVYNIMDKSFDEPTNPIKQYFAEKFINSFSLVSLFSITMWVHLQNGDDGLKEFIRRGCSLSASSILIEPQPWKCYRSAARRLRKMSLPGFPHPHPTLSITDIDREIFNFVTNECGMGYHWPLGVESWGRSLVVYHVRESVSLSRVMSHTVPDTA
jgi:SAM-dependent methyltransferase